MVLHSAPYVLATATAITILYIDSHARAAAPVSSDKASFLYAAEDSVPVLDHGLSGIDFTRSASPKVVEFYDPKCGACQLFRSNYVAVAKKVRAKNPGVEFYGVSCEAYQSICDRYDGPTVPRIFAFPGSSVDPAGGIEVPKGTGTVYFLSERLAKALRTPEGVASDAEKLGGVEAPKRRLEEEEFGDTVEEDDDDEREDEDEEQASGSSGSGDWQVSEDEDGDQSYQSEDKVFSGESDDYLPEEDNDASYGSEDFLSQDRNEKEETSGDREDESVDQSERPSLEDANKSKSGQDGQQEVPSRKKVSHGRYEDAALLEKYIADDKASTRNKRKQVSRGKRSRGKEEKSNDGTDHQEDSEEQGQQRTKPQDSNENQEGANQFEKYQHTDAYKNTMREFEAKDIKHGKPIGHHYNKMREERAAEFNKKKGESDARLRDARQIAKQKKLGSRQPLGETLHQERKPKDNRMDARAPDKRENTRQNFPSIVQSSKGGERTRAEREKPEKKKEREENMHAAREKLAQKAQQPARSIWGDASQKEASPEDKDSKANNSDEHETMGQQSPSSRQSIRGGRKEMMPEDINDAKSLLGRDAFPGSPYSIPIVNINKPQGQNLLLPPHDQMNIGGDHFINPFSSDPVKAKKFEEYLARRKQMLERREKWKHPIKSIAGGPSAKKEDIRGTHMKKSPMHNYKAQYNKQTPDLRPEAQRKTFGQKVLKNIPILKRTFKRSKGEETLNDAALSFTRGLLMGVFKSNAALDYKRKAALVDWFDLLRVSLPPEIGLHDLIDTLKYNIDLISQRQENLLEVINKYPIPDNMWSQDCTKGMRSGGFFCGFWKLLHVTSVGFAEQEGGLALRESNPSIRVFSPKEAGDVVREYMAYFFNCEKCSKRFIGKYDDCSFNRCNRLVDETADARAESWREFPLWLWQIHNDISISKSNRAASLYKKEGRKAEAQKWELSLKAVYPHIDQCVTCVTTEGTWELNQVYKYLEKEYWTFRDEVVLDPKMEKFLKTTDIEPGNVHGLGAYVLVALIMISSIFLKKYRIRATGRHKKVETPSVGGFSKKYRDS